MTTFRPLKNFLQANDGGIWGDDPTGVDDVMVLRSTDIGLDGRWTLENPAFRSIDPIEKRKKTLSAGDLVVVKSSGSALHLGKTAIVSERIASLEACYSNFVQRLVPAKDASSRFLFHFLNSDFASEQLQVLGNTTTGLRNLNGSLLGSIRCPDWDRSTQETIADLLDNELQRTDGLVNEKAKFAQLLTEKRAALISHAVTKGLKPDAPTVETGIPWLGAVPSNWLVVRSKTVLTEVDQRSAAGEEELLTVSHLTGVTRRADKNVNMFEAESNEGAKLCWPGDLVINTLWAWMGALGVSPFHGMVSPAYHVYRPSAALVPGYVDLVCRTPTFVKEVTRYSKGVWSSRLRLYPEGLFEVQFPIPPIVEQQQIVESVAEQTRQIDELMVATQDTMVLLKERRSALISAAVTGRLDLETGTEVEAMSSELVGAV
jgi:type I restriction enzyme, S subunit